MVAAKSINGSIPQEVRSASAMLEAVDVLVVPVSGAEWLDRWQKVSWAGVAAGALLLNLGAPFWFTVLKDLLRLRSTVAGQESQDRALRQATMPDLASSGATHGERGDLQAAG